MQLLAFLTSFAAVEAATVGKLMYGECPEGTPPGSSCGKITVPLTYKSGSSIEALDNRTITLGFAQHNATGNSTRGPLFANFGGPGTPNAFSVAASAFVPELGFSSDVRAIFDIVGVDPRGIGSSTPVKCDPDIFNQRLPNFVNNSKSFDALKNHSRRLGESCANLTGPLINYLDQIHVAKDYEVLRRAFKAKKFDYFGLSYGSFAGSTYASLFPKYVGRMAFDGIVDHSQGMVSALLTEASTYEATLNQFFKWCDENSSCALHGENSDDIFESVLANATRSPISAPGCKGRCQPNVTAEDMLYNVQSFLQFVDFPYASNWIDLSGAIAEAAKGNATALSTPLATSETSDSMEGSPFTYLAIGCTEWQHNASDAQDLVQRLQAIQPVANLTKGASQTFYYQSTCIDWPAKLSYPPKTYSNLGQVPAILLVHSTYDPSTSPVWADALRQQMPNATSITRSGYGHTSHFLLGETRSVKDEYLATGKLPRDGSVYST